jgi:ABC-type sugar transport system permease subunit
MTSKLIKRERTIGFFFTLPCLLFIVTFIVYPLFRNIYLSFHSYNPLQSTDVVPAGLANYAWLFIEPVLLHSLYITVLFTLVSVSAELIIGLTVALLLAKLRDIVAGPLARLFSSVFMIPWVLPGAAAAVAWRMIYHPYFGPLNNLIGRQIMWLSHPQLSLMAVVVADIWKMTPFFIFILLAGLISIPVEQFENARTDGASRLQIFGYIILPNLLPLILVSSAFRAIDAFTKIFDLVFIITGGGPGRATEVLPLLIYKTGLQHFRFGTASALSVVAIIISLFFGISLLRKRR